MGYGDSPGFVLQLLDINENFFKLKSYSHELLNIAILKFIRQFNTYKQKFSKILRSINGQSRLNIEFQSRITYQLILSFSLNYFEDNNWYSEGVLNNIIEYRTENQSSAQIKYCDRTPQAEKNTNLIPHISEC